MTTTRAVYLCRIGSGNPFFNCSHHLQEVQENLAKMKKKDGTPSEIRLAKIMDAPGESCEHCLGDKFNELYKKARERALAMYLKEPKK